MSSNVQMIDTESAPTHSAQADRQYHVDDDECRTLTRCYQSHEYALQEDS